MQTFFNRRALNVRVLVATAATLLAVGCEQYPAKVGSGIPVVRDRSAILAGKTVTGVRVETSAKVEIRQGAVASMVLRVDDNLEELIETRVDGETLVVGAKRAYSTREGVVLTITLPEVTAEQMPAEMAVEMAGSGEVMLKDLKARGLSLVISGSGEIEAMGGSVETLNAVVSGSGVIKAEDLKAKAAKAVVSGSGVVRLWASESVDAAVSGSGVISHAGPATNVKTAVTGSGTVQKK